MPKKGHSPEEIVIKLRQVDMMTSQGRSLAVAIRSIGVAEATYHRWRNEFGGLKLDRGIMSQRWGGEYPRFLFGWSRRALIGDNVSDRTYRPAGERT